MKKRIWIVSALALLLFAAWLAFSCPLSEQLPQGYWIDFSAEVGTRTVFPNQIYDSTPPLMYPNPQHANAPDQLRYMRVPPWIRSISPENVQKALRGRRVIPLDTDAVNGKLTDGMLILLLILKGQPSAYDFSFWDAQNQRYDIGVTNFGLIGVNSKDEKKTYLDVGLCFAGLRNAFGDARDSARWQSRKPPSRTFKAPAGDTVRLLDALPRGHWYRFRGGTGGRWADGTMQPAQGTALNPAALHGSENYYMRRPEGLRDYIPENIRQILKGRKVYKIEPTKEMLEIMNRDSRGEPAEIFHMGSDAFFGTYFQDAQGNTWRMLLLNNGLIYVQAQHFEYNEISRVNEKKVLYSAFFQDDGECYAAMKDAFGDLRDLESWHVDSKEDAR